MSTSHGTIRAVTLKTVLKYIIDYYSVDENSALKMFYESHIGECYSDNQTGLYGQSALHIFSLLQEELKSINS